MTTEIAVKTTFDLSPQNFEQALTFANYLADSDMVPKDFQKKPGNCLIAMQWGMEIGMKPLQALQNIAVINGRPSLWGDAVIALVRASPLCESIIETSTDDMATCAVKRRGEVEQSRTFSKSDAQAAGLLNKQGPWTQYRKRMMQMRARALALRDVFPDVLKGMAIAEEAMDIPTASAEPKQMGMVEQVQPARTAYSDADFEKNQPAWQAAMHSGKKTPAEIIAMVLTRGELTEVQKQRIRELADTPTPAEPADQITLEAQ